MFRHQTRPINTLDEESVDTDPENITIKVFDNKILNYQTEKSLEWFICLKTMRKNIIYLLKMFIVKSKCNLFKGYP